MAPDPASHGCIFCGIIQRSSPAHILYEDESVLAFLDLFPFTRGHALVVPKQHVDRLTDLAASAYPGVLAGLANVCRRMERLSTHYNVALNQGSLAGQIVFHLHFHIIPRYGEENPFVIHPRERLRDSDGRTLVAELTAP